MTERRASPLTHPLLAKIRAFDLDPEEYILFGSAPLFAHGICETLNDLDVVARGGAWRFALEHGEPGTAEFTGDPVRNFHSARIQFSRRWISARWDTDQLIASAVLIDGIPYAHLSDVIAYKRELDRPHDREAIKLIATYLVADPGTDAAPGPPDSKERSGDAVVWPAEELGQASRTMDRIWAPTITFDTPILRDRFGSGHNRNDHPAYDVAWPG